MREPTRSPVSTLRAPGLIWAALVFMVCLLGTAAAWYTTKSAVDARAQFDFASAKLVDAVRERVHSYSQVLWGAAGLLAASRDTTREQWRVYVDALDIQQRLPGLQGIGFARLVKPEERDEVVIEI